MPCFLIMSFGPMRLSHELSKFIKERGKQTQKSLWISTNYYLYTVIIILFC